MEIGERVLALEDHQAETTRRVNNCEKRLDDQEKLLNTLSVIQTEQKQVKKDLDEIKTDVKTLTSKSGKLWDDTTKALIVAVMTAIVSFILGRLL